MTVPVARTHVRRNVRMAVALVVGQAVLCVVIGYIALGGLGSHPKLTPQAVGPLAAPTADAPLDPSPDSPGPSTPGRPTTHGTPASPRVLPGTIAPPPPADAPQVLDVTSANAPAGTTAPPLAVTDPITPGDGTGSPSPTDDQGVAAPQNRGLQPTPALGESCDKAHENGTTSGGIDVVCLPDSQGDLIWQLPKQPPGQQK